MFFIKPLYKYALQNMDLLYKLVERFQDLSEVKNPAVRKAWV